ncbi:FAD-dependent monooxygenase [Bradyrhizobium sp. NP1]|uniref:FAD-dependent oxidoreductase n=1 Tax=Bradyrhizobium sp. NP1 TaxID=3049772 RepID=UPI0025A5EEB7|nr:FAD-dependent monooxygenase [Bradyrhizobium sp. NP1]WJR81443.1 FAD-dependent monooxygenase [Bradyrhizobium sp. NP1]
MTRRPRKAIIIGAGIAGPVAAILLKRAGIDAAIYEGWSYSTGIGGGLQIAPNGMHVLAEIGLASELIRSGEVADAFDFYSQNGARLGSIHRNMKARFGQPAVNMRRATLNEALVDKAWSSCVEVHFEKRLARIEDRADRPIVATFTDGSTAEGDFLIGADGVHSVVRQHVNPDGPRPFDTGLVGIGGFVPRSLLENAGIGPLIEATFGQSGFFGYGFCSPDPAQGAMWWSTQPSHGIDAATFRAMGDQRLKQHLRDFHQGWRDPIPRIIDAAENIVVTDTLDVATLPTWSRGRTLLIGDAAHATSPHAGQGASLALEDAMRLSLLMREDEELQTTFERFEAERRPRAERIVAIARRNGSTKREFSPTGAWIRDRMLTLLLPLTSRGMDFMYAYNPCEPTSRPRTSTRRDPLAA